MPRVVRRGLLKRAAQSSSASELGIIPCRQLLDCTTLSTMAVSSVFSSPRLLLLAAASALLAVASPASARSLHQAAVSPAVVPPVQPAVAAVALPIVAPAVQAAAAGVQPCAPPSSRPAGTARRVPCAEVLTGALLCAGDITSTTIVLVGDKPFDPKVLDDNMPPIAKFEYEDYQQIDINDACVAGLTDLNTNVVVVGDDSFKDLTALSGLTSVGGTFVVIGSGIESLEGLESLTVRRPQPPYPSPLLRTPWRLLRVDKRERAAIPVYLQSRFALVLTLS